MKRRILMLALVILLTACLTACGCEHEWAEANCQTPKTCTLCEKTEGEIGDHNWEDATCNAPKTCTVCALTEGDVKPHTVVEANYQVGETCSDCGAVLSDPVEPEFVRTGRNHRTVDLTAGHGKEYDYTTGKNNNTQAFGTIAWVSWAVPMDPTMDPNADAIDCYVPEGILPETVPISGIHVLMENVEGYQWRGIQAAVKIQGNYNMIWGYEDYYSLAQYDEDAIMEPFKSGNDDGMIIVSYFPVTMNGEVYEDCSIVSVVLESRTAVYLTTFYRVPVGYDGAVFSLVDSRAMENSDYTSEEKDNGFVSYENMGRGAGDVYFRLK